MTIMKSKLAKTSRHFLKTKVGRRLTYELSLRSTSATLIVVPIALLEHWFEQHHLKPRVVGEFEDSALLKTFGASGMGVFPVAEWVHEELIAHYAVKRIGPCEGVTEHFFAVGTEKKVQHPLVQRLLIPSV